MSYHYQTMYQVGLSPAYKLHQGTVCLQTLLPFMGDNCSEGRALKIEVSELDFSFHCCVPLVRGYLTLWQVREEMSCSEDANQVLSWCQALASHSRMRLPGCQEALSHAGWQIHCCLQVQGPLVWAPGCGHSPSVWETMGVLYIKLKSFPFWNHLAWGSAQGHFQMFYCCLHTGMHAAFLNDLLS